jgi:hypothetical protein
VKATCNKDGCLLRWQKVEQGCAAKIPVYCAGGGMASHREIAAAGFDNPVLLLYLLYKGH